MMEYKMLQHKADSSVSLPDNDDLNLMAKKEILKRMIDQDSDDVYI